MASVLRVMHHEQNRACKLGGRTAGTGCNRPESPQLTFLLYCKVLDSDCPSKSVEYQQPLSGTLQASGSPASGSHCKLRTSIGRNWGLGPPVHRSRRDTVLALAAPHAPACPPAAAAAAVRSLRSPHKVTAQPGLWPLLPRQVAPGDSPEALPCSSGPQHSRSPQRHWSQTRCAPHRLQPPERHKTTHALRESPERHLST